MKKNKILVLIATMLFLTLTGCATSSSNSGELGEINVISREDGSGTRGAFTELVGILEKDKDGNKVDRTYEEAIIQNGTNSVITSVEGDKNSIGYISLGSLNDSIKTLKIDEVEATAENVKNGTYKISRPFNIAYRDDIDELTQDFILFLSSDRAGEIVQAEGYIKTDSTGKYEQKELKGKLVIAGSTSVSPVMEKLSEEYMIINPEVAIEIQSTGSSAGMQSAIEGSSHIGMASRELDDDEKEKLQSKAIAIDGIAVIVNSENKTNNIKLEDLKKVYIGEITLWDKIK